MKKLHFGLLSLALLCAPALQAGGGKSGKPTGFGGGKSGKFAGFAGGKGNCNKSKTNILFGDKKTETKKVDDKKTGDRQPGRRPGGGTGAFQFQPGGRGGAALLSEKEIEELKLSSEVKGKVEKIVKDYEEKQRKAFEDLRAGGGRPDFSKLQEARTKAREEAKGAVKALLNDDQKKKFDDIKKNRPTTRPGGGFPGGGFPGGGFPGRGGSFNLGQVLPGNVKDRLELTDDQKKQIDAIEKELKEKLNKLLTEDQKKKLEQSGSGRPGGGRPGAEGRPGGGRPGAAAGGRPGGQGGRPGGQGGRPRPDTN